MKSPLLARSLGLVVVIASSLLCAPVSGSVSIARVPVSQVERAPVSAVEWVSVVPEEFPDAINNPLKGFRAYKPDAYGLLQRTYIPWNVIEVAADDSVDRIIAHTNAITQVGGRRFEDLNVKLVPRVFLDWDGTPGTATAPKQHWPADLAEFDYDSPAFQRRLAALVAKLGQAWDNDPRIFAVQMGLIGKWGEHHSPAPTAEQRRLLTDAFRRAFRNKPVLVRHTDPEFMEAGFGIYYDTFATLSREPPTRATDQFPSMATEVYPNIWRTAPIEGEVEYNWQKRRPESQPEQTFGRTPEETMTVPAYRSYMLDKIRRYHASYLGWISNYDATDAAVRAGAAELQKAFGYRFVIDSVSYPRTAQPGGELTVRLSVRNTGSAPFYLDWPVAVGLLDPKTRLPVWSAPLTGVDIRRWMPGEHWDSALASYRRPAPTTTTAGTASLPATLPAGEYLVALAILDRQGGMVPSVRFATKNYLRGGWHPFGVIGVGTAPRQTALTGVAFDSPAFDSTLAYRVPPELRAVRPPPIPEVKRVARWLPDPATELINPWRYWSLEGRSARAEKQIAWETAPADASERRVIRVVGDVGEGATLRYTFFPEPKLAPGRYHFACRIRGTPGRQVRVELADARRPLPGGSTLPLSESWQEHRVEFEVAAAAQGENSVHFSLPKGGAVVFEVSETRMRQIQ